MKQNKQEQIVEMHWKNKVKIMLSEWMFRMRDLGELKDFINKEAGFYSFECKELEEYIDDLLSQSRQEAVDEEREKITRWSRGDIYFVDGKPRFNRQSLSSKKLLGDKE